MCNERKRTEMNWLSVAGGLGLMLPNFTCHELPGRFSEWVEQVRLVDEIQKRGLILDSVRRRSDRLARADLEETV